MIRLRGTLSVWSFSGIDYKTSIYLGRIIREIVTQTVSLRRRPTPRRFASARVCAAEYYRLVSKPRKSTDVTSRNCWLTQHWQDYAFQRSDGTDVWRHRELCFLYQQAQRRRCHGT